MGEAPLNQAFGHDSAAPLSWHPLDLEERPIDDVPARRVIVVGAGISGINAAILLPAKVPGIDLVIYERSSDIVSCLANLHPTQMN